MILKTWFFLPFSCETEMIVLFYGYFLMQFALKPAAQRCGCFILAVSASKKDKSLEQISQLGQ